MDKIKNILDEIYYERMKILVFIIIGLAILSCILIKNNNEVDEEIVTIEKDIEEKIEEPPKVLYVDIKGEVVNPGCYEVQEGLRVKDVIELAGGILEDASTDNINLSTKVYDEMVIVIGKKEEVKIVQNSNDISINENKSSINNNSNITRSTNRKISINNASIEELCTLNGIKEARAQKIIDYRNNNGPFKNIEDIKNVSGIGDSIFEKIKDDITL